jgi:hypothetical protein
MPTGACSGDTSGGRLMADIPHDKPWGKRRLTVAAPDRFYGSRGMAEKLGWPQPMPETAVSEFRLIVETSDQRFGLTFEMVEERDGRGDIELYCVEDLPEFIDGDGPIKSGYCMPEGKREYVVVEYRVLTQSPEFRFALFRHEFGHALKLKHPADKRALSIMVPGLRREGESFYFGDWRGDDIKTLRNLYGGW